MDTLICIFSSGGVGDFCKGILEKIEKRSKRRKTCIKVTIGMTMLKCKYFILSKTYPGLSKAN